MRERPHKVCDKVRCDLCGHFIGVITSDGKGPLLDECAGDSLDRKLCTMVQDMEQFQPLRIHRRGDLLSGGPR